MTLLATKFWHRCIHLEKLKLWNYFARTLLFVLPVLLALKNAKFKLLVYEQASDESLKAESRLP